MLPAATVVGPPPVAVDADPQVTERRDIIALLLRRARGRHRRRPGECLGAIIGLALGGLAAYALRRGFLGASWTDARRTDRRRRRDPDHHGRTGTPATGRRTAVVLVTVARSCVAHLVAWRHPDPRGAAGISSASAALAVFAVVQASGDWSGGALMLSGLRALVPAVSLAFVHIASGCARGRRPARDARRGRHAGDRHARHGQWTNRTDRPRLVRRRRRLASLHAGSPARHRATLAAAARPRGRGDGGGAGPARRRHPRRRAPGADRPRPTGSMRPATPRAPRSPGPCPTGCARSAATCGCRSSTTSASGPALDWLVLRIERLAGGEVRLERTDGTRPPADVELAFFRVAQEALSNAVKHGEPPIVVRYHVDEAGRVSLTVDDAGPGIDAEGSRDGARQRPPRDAEHAAAGRADRRDPRRARLADRRHARGARVASPVTEPRRDRSGSPSSTTIRSSAREPPRSSMPRPTSRSSASPATSTPRRRSSTAMRPTCCCSISASVRSSACAPSRNGARACRPSSS